MAFPPCLPRQKQYFDRSLAADIDRAHCIIRKLDGGFRSWLKSTNFAVNAIKMALMKTHIFSANAKDIRIEDERGEFCG